MAGKQRKDANRNVKTSPLPRPEEEDQKGSTTRPSVTKGLNLVNRDGRTLKTGTGRRNCGRLFCAQTTYSHIFPFMFRSSIFESAFAVVSGEHETGLTVSTGRFPYPSTSAFCCWSFGVESSLGVSCPLKQRNYFGNPC